jgi:hypothetical protein
VDASTLGPSCFQHFNNATQSVIIPIFDTPPPPGESEDCLFLLVLVIFLSLIPIPYQTRYDQERMGPRIHPRTTKGSNFLDSRRVSALDVFRFEDCVETFHKEFYLLGLHLFQFTMGFVLPRNFIVQS